MGDTNVPASVKQPWKYGLELFQCGQCIDERTAPIRCHNCNNYGEFWVTANGAKIFMGELERVASRMYGHNEDYSSL